MPNLAICCPHCGSSDCDEYRVNAFVRRHCDTRFRWSNPCEVVLLHKPAHCECGKHSTGVCTRCEKPLCRLHHATWLALCTVWPKLDFDAIGRRHGWFSQSSDSELTNEVARGSNRHFLPTLYETEIAVQLLAAIGVVHGREGDLLCFDCAEAALPKLLQAVRTRNARLRERGHLCGLCERERTHEQNAFGSMYVVAAHHCQECRQPICFWHRTACKKCGDSFCKPHAPAPPDELCRACRPWLVTRALKAVIAAL
jgi:hypothetical protein